MYPLNQRNENDMNPLGEEALKYAQSNEKPPYYEVAIRGYMAGYTKAQNDNPYHWRDPNKEKPECCPVVKFTFVLACVEMNGLSTTQIVEYIQDSGKERWRIFKGEYIEDVPIKAIKAWMPLPYYK